MKLSPKGRRALRLLALGALLLALGAGWVWQRTLPLQAIDVVGAEHAVEAEIVALTRAMPDSVALYSLSPALLEDRVVRHPWVAKATVRRLPTGTLRIGVTEREPAALALDAAGRPSHFLDARGFAMPVAAASPALYDVPVLRGAPDYHPTQPVESAGLRSLLGALAAADAETQALVSEVDWGRTVTLWTTPIEGHGSLPVRLGRSGHRDQLRRLQAFWDQAVRPQPGVRFEVVDLRFDGQVVTREAPRVAPDTTAAPAGASRPASAASAPAPTAGAST